MKHFSEGHSTHAFAMLVDQDDCFAVLFSFSCVRELL